MSKIISDTNSLDQDSVKNSDLLRKIIRLVVYIPEIVNHTQNNKFSKNNFFDVIQVTKQLEHNSVSVNLAAINELERIAITQPKYYWKVMEILSKFVRDHTFNPVKSASYEQIKDRQVIQAAITFIGKRKPGQYLESEQIDLSYSDLRGINLSEANLENTNLYRVNFQDANLRNANLQGSILSAANLCNANLHCANLSRAILSAAKLNGANLRSANLQQANLYLAKLQGAILDDAILNGANLREAKIK